MTDPFRTPGYDGPEGTEWPRGRATQTGGGAAGPEVPAATTPTSTPPPPETPISGVAQGRESGPPAARLMSGGRQQPGELVPDAAPPEKGGAGHTAARPAPPPTITEPGLYADLDAESYHADPVPGGSLSSTGARRLLPPSCPALFRYWADHPEPTKRVFEEGQAAHAVVLGTGPELVLVDRDRWDTNAVKQEVAEIRARGAVPLKAAQFEQIEGMAAALREHPFAGRLLSGDGAPEQSLFWRDPTTGVMRRGRLDWLPETGSGRLIVPDYKTTKAADLDSLEKAIQNFGYHKQSAWYLDGLAAVMGAEDAAFVFIFQEKTPPYLVTVVEPPAVALRIGRARNRQAIDLYAECVATGHWPGYADDVVPLGLPAWAEIRELEEIA